MNPIKFLRISQIMWLIAGIFSLFCIIWIQTKTPDTIAWFFIISFVVSVFMYFWRTYQIRKIKSGNGK